MCGGSVAGAGHAHCGLPRDRVLQLVGGGKAVKSKSWCVHIYVVGRDSDP